MFSICMTFLSETCFETLCFSWCSFPPLPTHLLMYSPVRTMLQVRHLKQLTCHCFSNASRDWPCLISAPHPAQSGEKGKKKEEWSVQERRRNETKKWMGEEKDSERKREKRKCRRGRSTDKEKWSEQRYNCTSLNTFCAPSVVFYPFGTTTSLINSRSNVGYCRAVSPLNCKHC